MKTMDAAGRSSPPQKEYRGKQAMENISIDAAIPANASAIAKVHVESWQHAYRGQIPSHILDNLSVSQRAAYWLGTIQAGALSVFVASEDGDDGDIVGFCSVGPSRDAGLLEPFGELYAIYVRPANMGRGIGSALINAGERALLAGGFPSASLWVLSTNTASIAWYQKRGWRADGTTRTEQIRDFDLQEIRLIKHLA